MPTPTMSDEELDALFRRGAEAYPNDMPAAAWARMAATLGDEARTQRLRRKVARYFAGELLLIALLLWQVARLTIPVSNRPAELRQPLAQRWAGGRVSGAVGVGAGLVLNRARRAAVQAKQPTGTPSTRAPKAGLARLAQSEQPAAALGMGQLATLRATAASRRGHNALATTAPLPTLASSQMAMPQLVGDKLLVKKRLAIRLSNASAVLRFRRSRGDGQPGARPQMLATDAGHAGHRPTEFISQNRSGQSAGAGQYSESEEAGSLELLAGRVASLPVVSYPLPDSLRPLAVQRVPTDAAEQPRPPALGLPYRVVVGLLAGPSWSGVRTTRTAQLGADYGLALEYLFSTRLRLRVGLLSSQKNYQAASTDYVAPANWQWQPGKYNLLASCRITELPLDLRYDVRRRPTYAVFTSLGLNSLLMRNERYSYDWVINGQTYTKSAEVVNGSTHFWSVLNVAVGFEKSLGQRWSAQVEPFWQFPLGGVGAGQVRLTSAGASFSVKYGLLR